MRTDLIRWGLCPLLITLIILHHDFWWWDDARLFLGLPIGLSYHLLFCLGVSLLMWILIRQAWPRDLQTNPTPVQDENGPEELGDSRAGEPGQESP